MATPYFQAVPPAPIQWDRMWASHAGSMLNVLLSKANCAADLTLTVSAATTTFIDPRLSAFSVLTFMPTTANAAAEIPTLFVTAQNKGTATINHANTGSADRTYRIAIHG